MKSLQRTFEELALSEPSPTLRESIMLRVAREERLSLRHRFAWVSFGLALSLLALAAGAFLYGGALLQSDFWTLLSLLFSDLGVLAGSLQDFGYSLLETLPAVPLIALSLPLALFLWSLGSFFSLRAERHPGFFPRAALAP